MERKRMAVEEHANKASLNRLDNELKNGKK